MSIWGKIIGGTAGFALGGPIGAIIVVMVGGSFDRSKKRTSNFRTIPQEQKQNIFALSVIILSAKIAKADGQVTQDEIYAFKDKFKIPESEMPQVGKVFNQAKKSKMVKAEEHSNFKALSAKLVVKNINHLFRNINFKHLRPCHQILERHL